jgi:hypothetical protein
VDRRVLRRPEVAGCIVAQRVSCSVGRGYLTPQWSILEMECHPCATALQTRNRTTRASRSSLWPDRLLLSTLGIRSLVTPRTVSGVRMRSKGNNAGMRIDLKLSGREVTSCNDRYGSRVHGSEGVSGLDPAGRGLRQPGTRRPLPSTAQ